MDAKTPLYNVGKIITEQTFGFWTNLYETHHYRLIGGAPIWCFVNKPSSADRKIICEKLNAVRLFRNKIYHNEHVCFDSDKDQISFAYIEQTVKNIYELLSWIDPELVTYAKGYHRIQAEINKGYKL